MRKLNKDNYIKVGILGGTFDPPHIGHLNISRAAIKKIKLNKLMWIITKKNPLKHKPHLNTKIRIKLSKEITRKEKKISVYFFDNRVKTSNTFDLLNYIKRKNKKLKLFFIMGADNFLEFHKWNNWRKIPKLAKIVVFPRPNYSVKALNSIASKMLKKNEWMYISAKKINISSSLIRKF